MIGSLNASPMLGGPMQGFGNQIQPLQGLPYGSGQDWMTQLAGMKKQQLPGMQGPQAFTGPFIPPGQQGPHIEAQQGPLPPRLQAQVDSGAMTLEGAQNRQRMFQGGQLPGQQSMEAPVYAANYGLNGPGMTDNRPNQGAPPQSMNGGGFQAPGLQGSPGSIIGGFNPGMQPKTAPPQIGGGRMLNPGAPKPGMRFGNAGGLQAPGQQSPGINPMGGGGFQGQTAIGRLKPGQPVPGNTNQAQNALRGYMDQMNHAPVAPVAAQPSRPSVIRADRGMNQTQMNQAVQASPMARKLRSTPYGVR